MEDTVFDKKPPGSVGIVGLDLVRRLFGGSREQTLDCFFSDGRLVEGYSRLAGTDSAECSRSESNVSADVPQDDEDERAPFRKRGRPRQRRRPSLSSTDSSKRWSASDHCHHRRTKGFYCMRLRIVNMTRLVAMVRKVRVAYRRMMSAAAASKTILSLSDLYNDIADLIPVPGTSSKASTIVVIRPVKSSSTVYAIDDSDDEWVLESLSECGSESNFAPMLSSKRGKDDPQAQLRQEGCQEVKAAWPLPGVSGREKTRCRRFSLSNFGLSLSLCSCVWAPSATDSP